MNLGIPPFRLPLILILLSPLVHAQQADSSEPRCSNATVISVPSRPTVASATDTTQCGTVEAEYGLERQWIGGDSGREDLTGGLRFGITPNLDFHWASGDYLNLTSPETSNHGFGDTWLGLKYRFLSQTKFGPSLGIFYEAKVPSANSKQGLGSGQVDHSVALIASKDVSQVHFDFNAIELLAGRTIGSGFDHDTGFALATWVPVTHRLTAIVELYGYTTLDATSPAFASTMVGISYKVNPRMYLDSGLDLGTTRYAPNKRVYVGLTCALGNLYSWFSLR